MTMECVLKITPLEFFYYILNIYVRSELQYRATDFCFVNNYFNKFLF